MRRVLKYIGRLRRSARLPDWLKPILLTSLGHPLYPLIISFIAFCSTLTFTFPFVIVLIPAVLLTPRRWLLLGLGTGVFSGLGGGALVATANFMGCEVLLAQCPTLLTSHQGLAIGHWIDQYGLWALAVIAASPIPQTPAVLLYALSKPSVVGAMLAIGVGKTIKYVVLAWFTARYPARFVRFR